MKIFAISGYFVDDLTEFEDYLVTEFHDIPDGWNDEDFFFHGVSEEDLKGCVESREPVGGEFVITYYYIYQDDDSSVGDVFVGHINN